MGDWPARTDQWGLDTWVIGPLSGLSLGPALQRFVPFSSPSTTAWPAANRATLIPFRVPRLTIVYQAVVGCGSGAAGNFDVGVYDRFGNRLVSSGSTAQSSSVDVTVNLTDTELGQGVYYMALSTDSTAQMIAWPPNVYLAKMIGVRQASSVFTLPATLTFETLASAYVPNFSIWLRSA